MLRFESRRALVAAAIMLFVGATGHPARAEEDKPDILVIRGDDIGLANISFNNRDLMGYRTPNIDRIAEEGVSFTDYCGQQSCTAGRAAFIGGNNPLRTGMTKVGVPGAPEGWQASDVTIAAAMTSLGYATGRFGKNHQGDRDDCLPMNHGFDMTAYLSGDAAASLRNHFVYVNDDGEIVAVRWDDRKVVFKENPGQGFGVWREPFTDLRVPLVFNLRRDPFERAQHNANIYEDWALDRPFIIFGTQTIAVEFLKRLAAYPPSQTP
jgi:arylsulfatase A-like enzyme